MHTFVAVVLVLISVTAVWPTPFPTAKPVQNCTEVELAGSKLAYQIYLEDLVIDPPCEEEYCVAKKNGVIQLSVRFTPKQNGKELIVKAYEKQVAGLANKLLQLPFHTRNICDKEKYNVTCPFQAKIPIHAFRKKGPSENIDGFPKPIDFHAMVVLEDDAKNLMLCYTVKIKNEYYLNSS